MKLEQGQEVRVFDLNGRRMGQPEDGWVGTVEKVGRKLVHIKYPAGRPGGVGVFRIDRQSANDAFGHRYFRTLEQAELARRRIAAQGALSARKIRLDTGCEITLEQLEELAAVVSNWP